VAHATPLLGATTSNHKKPGQMMNDNYTLLLVEDDGVRVLDDRSLNGVFVNGERIVSHLLSDGDEIVIGRYVLRFADRTSATAASAAGAPALAE